MCLDQTEVLGGAIAPIASNFSMQCNLTNKKDCGVSGYFPVFGNVEERTTSTDMNRYIRSFLDFNKNNVCSGNEYFSSYGIMMS